MALQGDSKRAKSDRTRIPPLPLYCVLTDRDDGTPWLLTHSADFSHFAISDVIPDATDLITYAADSGPYFNFRKALYRLYARARRIGYERIDTPVWWTDQGQGGIWSRRSVEHKAREIVIPADFVHGRGFAHNGLEF